MTRQLFTGFGTTCLLFILTLVLSVPLGLIVCFGSMSKFKPLQYLSKLIVWIIRGTPLMLQIIVVFYVPGLLFDYPMAAILENRLLNEYGPSSLDLTSKLNAEGTALRNLFLQTPYWGGLYTETVVRLSKKDVIPTPSLSLSLFGERIREGQL